MYFAHLALAPINYCKAVSNIYNRIRFSPHWRPLFGLLRLCTSWSAKATAPVMLWYFFHPPFHPCVFFVGFSLIDCYYLFCHTLRHIISRLLRMHQFRFLHDVTKIQTKKLSILLSFYFYVASPQTSFGVRGGKWMRDERTPKDVCGEANFHEVLLAQYLNTFT